MTRSVTRFRQCLLGIAHAKRSGVQRKFHGLFILFALLAGLGNAAAQNLTLRWVASNTPGVAGYNIYYGTNSGTYPNKLVVGNVTSATISNLTAGATYYFVANAFTTNGDTSVNCSEASFVIPGLLTMSQGVNAGDPMMLQFPVEPQHWYEVQATTNLQSWVTIGQTTAGTSYGLVQFADTNASAFNSRFYRLVMH